MHEAPRSSLAFGGGCWLAGIGRYQTPPRPHAGGATRSLRDGVDYRLRSPDVARPIGEEDRRHGRVTDRPVPRWLLYAPLALAPGWGAAAVAFLLRS